MLKTYGLHSYVLNNNLKSLGLLAGFLLVIQLMFAAIWSFTGLFQWTTQGFGGFIAYVFGMTTQYAPSVAAGSLVWAFLAFLYYKHIVRGMTGLHEVTRQQEPRLFNIVENLSIATGLSTPRIEIAETQTMNAFALGLTPQTSTIGVTRGLLQGLNDRELEAVIAHEITHIRTLDVRLMTFATIFCGIIFSIGWFLTYRFREMTRQAKAAPLVLVPIAFYIASMSAMGGSIPFQAFGVTAVLIISALLISLCLRFAISRKREFVADLGACELTQNPEALISALAKIHGRNLMPHCDPTVQAMMISAPSEGLFASHPSLEERIDAIVAYAATHLNGLRLAPASARIIPAADTGAAVSGFSITAMKYPAWVSKPLIVLPAITAGLLLNHLQGQSPSMALEQLMGVPNLLKDVVNAPSGNAVFDSIEIRGTVSDNNSLNAMSDEKSLKGFIDNMGLGEWKMLLFYGCVGFAIVFSARLLRSFGFDSSFIRQLSGGPSKEMESDWEEDTQNLATHLNATAAETPPPHLNRLNHAMRNAITAHQQTPVHHQPLSLHQPARTVFGKR